MSTWYSKDLGDGVEAYKPTDRIQEAFTPIFVALGQPKDMAVFSRYDLSKNMVTAYFTPSACKLAEVFQASPCKKPELDRLGLLVGDQRAIGIHFPETQDR
tara:strand:+ start:2590 stop:2892 length:303 start_codon:yes stop_codon:yes gene_type:complete